MFMCVYMEVLISLCQWNRDASKVGNPKRISRFGKTPKGRIQEIKEVREERELGVNQLFDMIQYRST